MKRNLPIVPSHHPMDSHSRRFAKPVSCDSDKYRWIRAHRGNAAIHRALANSASDTEFDSQIEREMSMTAPAPRICTCLNRRG